MTNTIWENQVPVIFLMYLHTKALYSTQKICSKDWNKIPTAIDHNTLPNKVENKSQNLPTHVSTAWQKDAQRH